VLDIARRERFTDMLKLLDTHLISVWTAN